VEEHAQSDAANRRGQTSVGGLVELAVQGASACLRAPMAMKIRARATPPWPPVEACTNAHRMTCKMLKLLKLVVGLNMGKM